MKKLLIYEDDVDTLELCMFILEREGIAVIGHDSCIDIAKHIREDNPDAIILDYWLPGNGGDICLQLKGVDMFKHIPIILFSTHNDIIEKAAKAKADYCIQKPFEIDDLKSVVKKALGI